MYVSDWLTVNSIVRFRDLKYLKMELMCMHAEM